MKYVGRKITCRHISKILFRGYTLILADFVSSISQIRVNPC